MNFLLVINSNLGPILPRLRDIAGFLLRTSTPTPIRPNFVGVLVKIDAAGPRQTAEKLY